MIPQHCCIVSLTTAGRELAEGILRYLPNAEHLHQPKPFGEQVRQRFEAGMPLIMIAATGIVVRTLASSLRSKWQDPPVLVLDEQGAFVVPLLSGHEGGANAWAQQLSALLGAHCVVTGATAYTHPIYVAGVGCERHCPRDVIHQLAVETLVQAGNGLSVDDLHCVASIDIKNDEQGILTWGAERRAEPLFYPATRLLDFTDQLSRRSEVVFREVGCYGVAEAAALAAVEQLTNSSAELLICKHKNKRATFAVARGYLDKDVI